jgi:hypothetical protein
MHFFQIIYLFGAVALTIANPIAAPADSPLIEKRCIADGGDCSHDYGMQ